jgi:hypothetical protein
VRNVLSFLCSISFYIFSLIFRHTFS